MLRGDSVLVRSVHSLRTYRCESWALTIKVIKTLNGTDSQANAITVTDGSAREEARSKKQERARQVHIRFMQLLVYWIDIDDNLRRH